MGNKKEESKEFADAIFGAGTYCSVVCGFCGHTHFCNEEYGEWGEEDGAALYRSLVAGAEKEPDKYTECDYTIRFGVFDGKTAVEGCPCGKLKMYEDWIWDRRYSILNYLTARYKLKKVEIDGLRDKITKANEAKGDASG